MKARDIDWGEYCRVRGGVVDNAGELYDHVERCEVVVGS